MARVCSICKRGTTSGNLKSHSQRKTKRAIGINLQSKKINGKSAKVCARCIKEMAKPIKK
ncbi:MAG TPA: L28 family ribosomal protein [bacterium]|jgi:ribosomal protein L28|nr:L28 family ribosomal protein [bacterium]HOG38096.1 L28 family ribosomal protein [bacterium]HQI03152.1 L28 family ribosomal protein [bacterium]